MDSLGDLLKVVQKKAQRAKRELKGARLAQKILRETLGPAMGQAEVASLKVGVITVNTPSAAQFQELEGFHRESLIAAFRAAGLKVSGLRVRLRPAHE